MGKERSLENKNHTHLENSIPMDSVRRSVATHWLCHCAFMTQAQLDATAQRPRATRTNGDRSARWNQKSDLQGRLGRRPTFGNLCIARSRLRHPWRRLRRRRRLRIARHCWQTQMHAARLCPSCRKLPNSSRRQLPQCLPRARPRYPSAEAGNCWPKPAQRTSRRHPQQLPSPPSNQKSGATRLAKRPAAQRRMQMRRTCFSSDT